MSPSGKLAETFPKRLEDNPSFLNFPGEATKVEYREGLFVGYRYYDTARVEPLFPFGYGLSYARFEYANLRLDKSAMCDTERLEVSVEISTRAGRGEGSRAALRRGREVQRGEAEARA